MVGRSRIVLRQKVRETFFGLASREVWRRQSGAAAAWKPLAMSRYFRMEAGLLRAGLLLAV